MNIENINGYSLINLNKINIILGKNGCGKSTLCRQVETGVSRNSITYGKTKYISPERGGSLTYEAGIEQNITNDLNWLSSVRRRNQASSFRQQSVAQYKKLENLVLREIESVRRDDTDYTFDIYVNKINTLLDNIEIVRHGSTFKIFRKGTTEESSAETLSSGESELISLGIECLIFSKEIIPDKENILFLDEPDVHLHPDLQVRLMNFLTDLIDGNNFKIIMATHSTAILGALENYSETHLAFLSPRQTTLEFSEISDTYKKILPVFGAHPLSNIFNRAPVLLVEGEDDERIWQQVVRSSNGSIKLYPCSVGGVSFMNDFELETKKIISTVYDGAKGYSLRDSDDSSESIDDLLPIVRMKLSCRNAENLLLSDEVLVSLGTNWIELERSIEEWLNLNTNHPHFSVMKNFKNSGYDRKQYDIKEIRNDFMGIIGSPRPWEVSVGQVIARLNWNDSTDFTIGGSIFNFLGRKTTENLLPKIGE